MKYKFLPSIFMCFSLSVYASHYETGKQWAQDAIEDFPGSVRRAQMFRREPLDKFEEGVQKGYHTLIADWTGGYQQAFHGCVAKHRYTAAVLSLYACEEKKDEIIKKAQEDATECLERFEKFRQAYQAYNVGGTQSGSDFLDRLAAKHFKP